MLPSNKLSVQDRRELEKFTKFLVLKATQVIVQSRLGEKIQTSSNPISSSSDWFTFYLSIADLPDVQAEAKKALSAQMLSVGLNMCTEISLKTTDGDMLVLETWSLGVREESDPTDRLTISIYNRMSILLKSLIAATRVTPAYKLSCRQGPDSYVICYRCYVGEPQFYLLGEGYQQVKIGEVGMPMGTVSLKVMYRTKMTITPQKIDCPMSSMMKSDYFKPDMSPEKRLIPYTLDTFRSPLKENPQDHRNEKAMVEQFDDGLDLPEHKRGAFASSLEGSLDASQFLLPETTSFLSVLPDSILNQSSKMTQSKQSTTTSSQEGQLGPNQDSSSEDLDFVLVELKPPFADCEGNGDLGTFFRDFQTAPSLLSFAAGPTLEEQLTEIREQLVQLETSSQDLDFFVDSLCNQENKAS